MEFAGMILFLLVPLIALGTCGYLAYRLTKMCSDSLDKMSHSHQLSQAALSQALLEAAEMLKSQTIIEKASHDRMQADTDIRVKVLQESLEIERDRGVEASKPKIFTLEDGRTINTSEWSQL